MTRETKIGLLVGLAFIIVIGILLSDHLTSTNEPQPAQLARAGDSVRSGVTVPGTPAPTAPVTTAQQPVQPQQTVPTKEELTPRQPPVEIVQIGGSGAAPATRPSSQNQHVAQNRTADEPRSLSAEQGVTGTGSNSVPIARPTDDKPGSLGDIAKRMGEEVVPTGAGQTQQQQAAAKPASSTQLPPGAKQYKAEAGDTLSKLAGRFMGANTPANRAAIVAANPSLQKNPDIVVAGRAYVIPAAGGSSTASATPPPQSAPQAPAQSAPPAPQQVAQSSSSSPEYFYTVRPNDSLTKIAVEQLGSAGAVNAIRDLNKDLLKGGDVIHPNMKLRLPAKPIAAAVQ